MPILRTHEQQKNSRERYPTEEDLTPATATPNTHQGPVTATWGGGGGGGGGGQPPYLEGRINQDAQ